MATKTSKKTKKSAKKFAKKKKLAKTTPTKKPVRKPAKKSTKKSGAKAARKAKAAKSAAKPAAKAAVKRLRAKSRTSQKSSASSAMALVAEEKAKGEGPRNRKTRGKALSSLFRKKPGAAAKTSARPLRSPAPRSIFSPTCWRASMRLAACSVRKADGPPALTCRGSWSSPRATLRMAIWRPTLRWFWPRMRRVKPRSAEQIAARLRTDDRLRPSMSQVPASSTSL